MWFYLIKISQYFPKTYEPFGGAISVKGDLSNDATKADIKKVSHVNTSSFALKTNLADLKTEVDKLDIDNLVPASTDLSKLYNVVKKDAVKKNVYDKFVSKVNSVDTSGFVLKTKYDTDKSELENKIADASGLVKKTYYNTKTNETEGKIPNVNNLVTKTTLNTVENKIPDIINLVKKIAYDYNKFDNRNHDKYIDTSEFNKWAADVFNARIAQVSLVTKRDLDTKLSNLNRKTTSNKTDNLLVQNEWNKLKTFDWSYFIGKNYFEEDDTQNYLVFQPISRYFKMNWKYILSWKYKGLSNKTIFW